MGKLVVIHHNDMDGRSAAAVVKLYHKDKDVVFWEVDYKDILDFTKKVDFGDEVVIVDFSLKPEQMKKLISIIGDYKKVTWIDHHKTAEEYDYGVTLPGLRDFEDKKNAGCELTWMYFFKQKTMPTALKLIGDYDKFALKMQPDCFEFYEGMKMHKHQPTDRIWDSLLDPKDNIEVWNIMQEGQVAIRYRDVYCEDFCKQLGFEVDVDGRTCFAANMHRFGSQMFGDRMNKYPACVAFVYDGKQYVVSLYSKKVDVSEICKKFGGGGHKNAAGFVAKQFPFKKKQEDSVDVKEKKNG